MGGAGWSGPAWAPLGWWFKMSLSLQEDAWPGDAAHCHGESGFAGSHPDLSSRLSYPGLVQIIPYGWSGPALLCRK